MQVADPSDSGNSINRRYVILQKLTREIMGKNIFGVEEAIKHLGVNPSKQQLSYLAKVPWSEEVLESHKDTHILVAVFPMSILDIRGKVEHKLFFRYEDSWYNKQEFAKDKDEVNWRLVRKTSVSDSTSKNWDDQQALLDKNEETPSARVCVYTIIGHFLATGERLFHNIYVRTSSVRSGGHRVHVGSFGRDGLRVDLWWDAYRSGLVGVSSAKKPA